MFERREVVVRRVTSGIARSRFAATLLLVLLPLGANVARVGATSASPTPVLVVRAGLTSTVYELVSVPCSSSSCLRLERVSSNASRRRAVSSPPIGLVSGVPSGSLDRLVFANVRDGYAVLGESTPSALYVTNDGAETWRRTVVKGGWSILQLSATPSALYAIIARCPHVNESCNGYLLARSTLSGRAWSFSAVPRAQLPEGMGVGLGAWDHDVWLSEQPPGDAVIYRSHDDGRTFTKIVAAQEGSVSSCALSAFSATSLWAQCPTGMDVSFHYSSDGGVRWQNVPTRQFSGTGGGAFDPVSATLAYFDYGLAAPTGHDNVYRVTDGGRSVVGVGLLKCSDVASLVFTSRSEGLAVCIVNYQASSTVLLRTTDGGAAWTKVSLT